MILKNLRQLLKQNTSVTHLSFTLYTTASDLHDIR